MINLIITPKQIEELGAALAQGFTEQLGVITSEESISRLARNIYSSFKANETEAQDLSHVFTGLGENVGKSLGEGLNSAIDTLGLSKKTELITKEINKGIEPGLDELVQVTTLKIDLLRTNIQKMFSETIRDTTLSALPWIVLSAAVTTAVPLFVLYVYHRAKRNMEQEKLEKTSIQKKMLPVIPYTLERYSPIL
jgi:hypothetical protein